MLSRIRKVVDGVELKRCPVCRDWKPLIGGFHKNKSRTDGVRSYCLECDKGKKAATRQAIRAQRALLVEVTPPGTKRCSKCKDLKPTEANFSGDTGSKDGFYGWCKLCVNTHKVGYMTSHPQKTMLRAARQRAEKYGVDFTMVESDIVIPTHCPFLGIPLGTVHGNGRKGPSSPSLDRIIPELGYVPKNVIVISDRANILKRDATFDELRRIADALEALIKERGLY